MVNSLLLAIVQFFIQPLFLVGLLFALWLNRTRVSYERQHFQSAIYRDYEEVKDYLLAGLIPGIVLSVISVGLGVTLTVNWILLYQIVSILFLIFGARFSHPLFSMPMSAVISWVIYRFFADSYSNIPVFDTLLTDISAAGFDNMAINWLLLLAVATIVGFLVIKRKQYKVWTPYFMMSKRGIKVSSYRIQEFFVMPLLLVVPGEAFTAIADWWPVFSIGNQTFAFFLLPMVFGLRFTAQSHTPLYARDKVNKELLIGGLITVIGLLLAIFLNVNIAWITFAIVFVYALIVLIRHRMHERNNVVMYSPADEGVRIVGIRPNSPADKLNVSVGDVILNINDIPVNDVEDFTQALEKNRSFIRLRLRRFDGEIILESSSLYKDDPYDLGFILLSQENI